MSTNSNTNHRIDLNHTAMLAALAWMTSACVVNYEPIGDDDAADDTTGDTSGDGDTSESGTSDTTDDGDGDGDGDTTGDGDGDGDGDTTDTTETGDGDGDCADPLFVDFFTHSIEVDGEPIGANLDLDTECIVVDDGTADLQLDCPQFDLTIAHTGDVSAAIPDSAGGSVHVRVVTADGWVTVENWVRLDFVSEETSVFLIDALTLAPSAPTSWIPPWGLSVVEECAIIDDGCGEWVGQRLGVAREGQTLELLQGETGSIIGGTLELWVEASWRYETIGPACDAADSWKKLALVSQNLVEGEVCIPGETDPCGTGLECCYPCGIPDCDFVCQPEDPESMGCPPPPP